MYILHQLTTVKVHWYTKVQREKLTFKIDGKTCEQFPHIKILSGTHNSDQYALFNRCNILHPFFKVFKVFKNTLNASTKKWYPMQLDASLSRTGHRRSERSLNMKKLLPSPKAMYIDHCNKGWGAKL